MHTYWLGDLGNGSVNSKLQELGCEVELHDVAATMHGFDNAVNARITRECVENRVRFFEELY